MHAHIKNNFLFYTFTLLIGFNAFFLINTPAQVGDGPGIGSASENYTFETINVPGVDFLSLTASSDFEDYAGYTKSADGEKDVAFTLIDGVFTTYDFPGSQNTYFFALGNNGNAAGHYEDSDGLFHGVVLQDGELREYNFPDSVETEIYGISDATGALTGNFTDASGIRRGFTGETIIEYPDALETFADFVNASGTLVGSYVNADGIYYPYVRIPAGNFISLDLPEAANLEYFFVHGINDARAVVARFKHVDDVPSTYIGTLFETGLQKFKVPDSVSTEGWNINQDGSIVGHYDSADGRRHGFIAKPIDDTAASVDDLEPVSFDYIFESIDVPGVDFLALTASSDFFDYAGYTRSPDGEKDVAFTLIDGVFTTYDFPGSLNTYFYALGNDGRAAGHYEGNDGLYHGVILENGELQQYDFPGAAQTFIYAIDDATGILTGDIIDPSGVHLAFTGDTIVEFPGAVATYSGFRSSTLGMMGTYRDAEGIYNTFVRNPDGRLISLGVASAEKLEFFFLHGLNDAGTAVGRGKPVGRVPYTIISSLQHGFHYLRFPGSVSTEGWNINQDGSVVGHYESADGRVHGFIAKPTTEAVSDHFGNFYTVALSKGLNMLSVPLAPWTPMTAKSLVALTGATTIITLDAATQQFMAWTPGAPDDGFPIEGGKGYIVNVPQTRNFAFVGAPWTDQIEKVNAPAAPAISTVLPQKAWAFVVSGRVGEPKPYEGKPTFDGYQVIVHNLRTDSTITAPVQGDYFAAATADLTRRSVVQVGDVIEVRVIGPDGNFESQTLRFKVTPEHLANAVLPLRLDGIGQPTQNLLLQNYPNPFNPETWIPYQLSEDSPVSVYIYDTTGQLIRTLSLGFQSAGFYNSRGRAVYWDGRNALGERVASGVYFYTLTAGDFTATRKMLIRK
ncbi:MAG: T9SS type A sorting domain-containing protein [Candidatus Poribacteria bacterium]|nr:T9SS type A sorting domain-containing protein [Candidatus Poribacteria bacterium]